METAADLAAFLADFGVPVVFGAIQTTGIFDMPGLIAMNEQLSTTDYTLRYRTAAMPDLDTDDAVTVNGGNYTVRHTLPIGDGAFSIAALKKA